MRDGTLSCVIVSDGQGVSRRMARLAELWALRDRLADRILLPDLAIELGVRYHDLYSTARRLGLELDRHPTSRQFEVSADAAELLRAEYARVRALHRRSMKLSAAAGRLELAVGTVGLLAKRGELEVDPETDASNARFVTRTSVEKWFLSRPEPEQRPRVQVGVPLADVVLFTGRGRSELHDLVRAGILEEVPGRSRCKLTAATLQEWLASV